MLVLSRKMGESLLIADRIVMTVAVATERYVDIGLSDQSGQPLGIITLTTDRLTPVAEGVRGILLGVTGDRIRLGFEHPTEVNVQRL